jgi:RND family efflux transporter MFP subunit
MRTRTLAVTLVAAGTLAGAFLLWGRPVPAPRPKPASAAVVPEETSIRCEGRVAAYPGADIVLAPEYPGRLAELPVRELDRVRAGQVLARIDSSEQEAALAAARAHVAELEADLRFLQLEQARQKRLLELGAVNQRSFDDADSKAKLAQARVDAARAQVAQQEAVLAKLVIRAPFSGTVVERDANPGELLVAGSKLLRLVDLDRVRIEAEVDEYDLARLRLGSAARVEAEGMPGSWQGRVEEVPAAVAQRTLKALDPARPTDIRVALVKIALVGKAPFKLGQRVELGLDVR